MYKILEKRNLSEAIYSMKIDAPLVAKNAKPGQFIILRVDENGERVVFTISDYDNKAGWVDIIVQRVGFTTELLGGKEVGDSIEDFAGPLGKPSRLDNLKRVLCVGGGVGIAPLYPQIKYLKEQGTSVDVIIGARSQSIIILEDAITAIADHVYLATDDGTAGHKGLVTEVMEQLFNAGNEYDEVIVAGPMIMMKFCSLLTKKYGIKTTASMNPIMVDGTGMCGCCRVTVGGETRYACVDGPDFDAHQINFDEAMRRLTMYKAEEAEAHQCKIGRGK
jgi:ferredoxin--NADP+ reductase